MFLVSLFGDQGLFAYRSLRGEAVSLRDEVGALKIKQQDLGREIRLLRGDPATIERLARERLGLVKAGEIVIQLPPPKAARD
jgi:cell division protein FtsB